jgi:hypothetical protein
VSWCGVVEGRGVKGSYLCYSIFPILSNCNQWSFYFIQIFYCATCSWCQVSSEWAGSFLLVLAFIAFIGHIPSISCSIYLFDSNAQKWRIAKGVVLGYRIRWLSIGVMMAERNSPFLFFFVFAGSIVLLHLFSRGPVVLKSPYQLQAIKPQQVFFF